MRRFHRVVSAVDAAAVGVTWESSRTKRRNATARDLRTPKYKQRVVPNKKRREAVRRVDVREDE